MNITEHVKRRTGTRYWVYEAHTPGEVQWLEMQGCRPSKYNNANGMKYYSRSEAVKALAYETFLFDKINAEPVNEEEDEMANEWIADYTEAQYDNLSADDKRKAAGEAAKKLGKSSTEARNRLNADEKRELVLYGIWPVQAPVATPDPLEQYQIFQKMVEAVVKSTGAGVDMGQLVAVVNDTVEEALQNHIKRVEVVLPTGEVKDAGLQHQCFEKIVKLVQLRENFALVGPAGSGKTHTVKAAAEACGLKFYSISFGQQTTKTDLLGFTDAHGTTHRTQLRDAVEFGGVFLADEADAGNANTIVVVNAMTSNGWAAFPDGMVKVHEDFVCALAMNTYGRGADRQYVGRNQLDAATLDRFAVIDFDYDEGLESCLAKNLDWTKRVQSYRKAAWAAKQEIVISPRASIKGAKLIAAGFPLHEVEEMVIWKGVNKGIRDKVIANLN